MQPDQACYQQERVSPYKIDAHPIANAASENVTGLWWNPGMEMFTIVLRGPFLFAASIGFVEGLDPTAYTGHLCHGAVGVKYVPTL